MFGGIPKLFDRAFFIGYYLPAFLLFLGFGTNLFAFGYVDSEWVQSVVKDSTLGATTLSLVIVWLLSILLMSFNRQLIRLLEGYGDSNPFRIFLSRQQQEFKERAELPLRRLNNVLDARRRGVPELEEFRELAVWNAVGDFPEDLELVLPTRLGNVMRAYERYSGVVYEMEAIVLWPRLFMIIPEKTRDRIRESEGLFSFAINMLLTSILVLVASCVMLATSLYHVGISSLVDVISWPTVLVLVSAFFLAWYSWWVLPNAARQRGEQIKSTFDLYRSQLADALGFQLPATESEERKMWRLVSRRMLLRVSEDRLLGYEKSLDDFRKKRSDIPKNKEKASSELESSNEFEETNDIAEDE